MTHNPMKNAQDMEREMDRATEEHRKQQPQPMPMTMQDVQAAMDELTGKCLDPRRQSKP